jgi:16S rRNA processing protein RimM
MFNYKTLETLGFLQQATTIVTPWLVESCRMSKASCGHSAKSCTMTHKHTFCLSGSDFSYRLCPKLHYQLCTMPDRFLEIGKIVGAQGLKGEVRIYPSSDFPERFLKPGRRWLLKPGQTDPENIKLLHGRYLDGKGLYVVHLAGISDRTQAEALKDARLLVSEQDRPSLEEDEFHIVDLIGLSVFRQDTQALVGTVVSVIAAGNDLLEVQPTRNETGEKLKTLLIPFVKAIVPTVDLEQRRIEITPPTGLID